MPSHILLRFFFLTMHILFPQSQKSRIATLFFPLIPLTIKNLARLKRDNQQQSNKRITKSQTETSMVSEPASSPAPSSLEQEDSILSSSGGGGGVTKGGAKRSLVNELNSSGKRKKMNI